jgi:hypothetical protein
MPARIAPLACAALALSACGSSLNSDQKARLAYIGLDRSIGKALSLGFAGFNAATSANIDPQSAAGDAKGTLTITGQVDQGSSANKGMRLREGMVDYSDGKAQIPGEDQQVDITYSTSADAAAQPALTAQLKSIPTGTYEGSLIGAFTMTGDLAGDVSLNLSFTGQLEDDGTGKARRKAGSTHVTGTATASGATYNVDVSL